VDATVHYLNWDQEARGEASELFHKLGVQSVLDEDEQPSDTYSREEFDDLYREVAEIDVDDPEEAWQKWNRGSGRESREFYDAEVRSMSVGDVLEMDGTFYQAQNIGWEEIKVEEKSTDG
jgi:hypothetical protein